MKKSYVVTLGFALMIAASLAFTKDDPRYKNLQVLPKNITEQQLDSVMHNFTDALSVKCSFCHVKNKETNEWDHASDANKHKLITRDMMRMTTEINKEYFDYTGAEQKLGTPLMVTCYTCHNGSKEPAVNPPATKDSSASKAGR